MSAANHRVYVDYAGEPWRECDVVYGVPPAEPHKRRRLQLGDLRANYRFFANASGECRAHCFQPGDDRGTEPDVLREQDRRAGFTSRRPFDASEREPR